MLDFHGLFPSYVALFLGGVYMEIKSLRLDLHLKTKQKNHKGSTNVFIGEERKKKKKPREEGVRRRKEKKKKKKPDARPGQTRRTGSRSRDPGGRGARRDLGRGATAACVAGLDLARSGS